MCRHMRVVVFGATGNVGTSLIRSLGREAAVESVLGVARRLPRLDVGGVDWAAADVATSELRPLVRGADAVVHLAWAIQPSHHPERLWRTNVQGSTRVFRALAEERVPTLVHASSVGVYSPGPKDRAVDETWPRLGIASSLYSRHKAEVERALDGFARERPLVRVVRLRPGLTFKRESAAEQRRLFAGPLLPTPLLRRGLIPVVPAHPRLRFQGVHSDDVAEAYRLALLADSRGPFNVAAEPVLAAETIAQILGARPLPVPAGALRGAAAVTWRLRLQPTPPGWIDLALGAPLLDTTRARTELGWEPRHRADDALREVLEGMRDGAGATTPPLEPDAGGRLREREVLTGVGSSEERR